MGRHSLTGQTDEIDKITVTEHNLPQHRTDRKSATASFVVAFIGLVMGWVIFGIPSAVATAMAIRNLRDGESDSSNNLLAKVALVMGVAGMVGGAVTAYIVMI